MNMQHGWLWFLLFFGFQIYARDQHLPDQIPVLHLMLNSYVKASNNVSEGLYATQFQQIVPQQPRTKIYQESIQQQQAYEQCVSEYLAIKKQEPRCALVLTDGVKLKNILEVWQQELEQIRKTSNQKDLYHLEQRIKTLATTPLLEGGYVLNSDLESLLLYELKTTYNEAQIVAQGHPENLYAQQAVPLIFSCAQAAQQERDVQVAFSYADAAHTILALVKRGISFLGRVSDALVESGVKSKLQHAVDRGLLRGLKEVANPEHWRELSKIVQHSFVAVQQGVSFVAKRLLEFEELEHVLDLQNEPHREQIVTKFFVKGNEDQAAITACVQQHWKELYKTPWDELVTCGVQKGCTLLFDLAILDGAGLVASASGRKVLKEVATVFKESDAVIEAYCVEVAGIGKMVAEEEVIAIEKAVGGS